MRPVVTLPRPDSSLGTEGQREWARLWARLFGPFYRCVWEGTSGPFSLAGAEAIVWGFTLRVEGHDVVERQLAESFPDTAVALLSEWERRLGVPVDPSRATADRQAALLAKTQSHVLPTDEGLQTALRVLDSAALVQTTNDCTVQATLSPLVFQNAETQARARALLLPALPSGAVLVIVEGTGYPFTVGDPIFGRVGQNGVQGT